MPRAKDDKDFLVIADILRELKPLFTEGQFRNIVNIFSNHLRRRFSRFDRAAFEKYISKKEGP
jgi:hypothetical protein